MTQQSNPYAAPKPKNERPDVKDRIPSLTIRLAKWGFICGLSAIPSFIWATNIHSSREQILAMLVGVFIFAVLYATLEATTYVQRLLKDPTIRGLAYFTYGARLGCSVVFPVGMFLDCIPGMFSVQLVESLYGDYSPQASPFSQVLLTTLVQGVFLNAILLGFMSIVYGIYAVSLFSIRRRHHNASAPGWPGKRSVVDVQTALETPDATVALEAELIDAPEEDVIIAQ